MKTLTTFASAAAVALSLAAAAVPAHASVFADFTPNTNSSDFRWINSGANNNGTGGHLISVTANNQTSAHGVATHFTFLDPSLSALAFLPATFTVDATVSTGNAALKNGANVFTQTSLNGSFGFVYAGPTTTIDGVHLVSGVTNLLSGVFTDAWIQGSGGSGSINAAHGNGGAAHYASDVFNFSHLAPGSEEFAFNILSVSPNFAASAGKSLKTFRANGAGNFSFAAVPEPATWGLMIVGFGGIGAMVRNNRRRSATATA